MDAFDVYTLVIGVISWFSTFKLPTKPRAKYQEEFLPRSAVGN